MKRLVLIDGHGILHRAYHALPPLTTSKGELVNAVFGFISMLLRVISDLKPFYIAVVFDRPEPTFRQKLYKDYQAQRPKTDEELVEQIGIVKKVLETMNIPIYEKAGFEADDIIATLAKQAGNEIKTQRSKLDNDLEKIIVTGDRDILQLVDDKTKVYMPVKGLSRSKLYDEKEVGKKFGIKPSKMVDFKALIGDPSDNYKGVSGVGPKTAGELLSKYKTLEKIYKHLDSIEKKKLKKALSENKDEAMMAKKLAKIVKDVPIEFNLEKCKIDTLDKPEVKWLFAELEFKSLIPRLSNRIKNSASTETTNRIKNQESRIKEKKDSKKKQRNQQLSLV